MCSSLNPDSHFNFYFYFFRDLIIFVLCVLVFCLLGCLCICTQCPRWSKGIISPRTAVWSLWAPMKVLGTDLVQVLWKSSQWSSLRAVSPDHVAKHGHQHLGGGQWVQGQPGLHRKRKDKMHYLAPSWLASWDHTYRTLPFAFNLNPFNWFLHI